MPVLSNVEGVVKMIPKKPQTEEEKLIKECQILLNKIAHHPYRLRMLMNAKSALEMIANYKRKDRNKRNSQQVQ